MASQSRVGVSSRTLISSFLQTCNGNRFSEPTLTFLLPRIYRVRHSRATALSQVPMLHQRPSRAFCVSAKQAQEPPSEIQQAPEKLGQSSSEQEEQDREALDAQTGETGPNPSATGVKEAKARTPRPRKTKHEKKGKKPSEDTDKVFRAKGRSEEMKPHRPLQSDSSFKSEVPMPSPNEEHSFVNPPLPPGRTEHEPWYLYKLALKRKFPEGWNPRKKISPDAMEGMRALHAQYPEECTREALANQFKISQEAVRRILKAKVDTRRNSEAMEARQRDRWAKRHDRIWDQMSQIGLRPKRRDTTQADQRREDLVVSPERMA